MKCSPSARKMRIVVYIFLCSFILLLAAVVQQVIQRLTNLPVPERLPVNSTWAFKVNGFCIGIAKDVGYLGSLFGIGGSYFSNIRSFFAFVSKFSGSNSFTDQLEINDTQIFGTSVRIYRPVNRTDNGEVIRDDKLLPAVIYLHGGGWSIGSLDSYDNFCCRISVSAQVVVISVDYRQAPEFTYPTQFNDCYNVTVGVLNSGTGYGIDVSRIVIAGDSAGGNLAAAVTHYLASVAEKHCSRQYLSAQILMYPNTQMLDFNLPSYQQNSKNIILSRRDVAAYVSLYLCGSLDLTDILLSGNHSCHLHGTKYFSYLQLKESKDELSEESNVRDQQVELSAQVTQALTSFKASPLMAESLRGIPQTFILTAEFDPTRDDGVLYALRLQKAGVEVKHVNYYSFHGFVPGAVNGGPGYTVEGNKAFWDIIEYIKDATALEDVL